MIAIRLFYLTVAVLIAVGIYLSGFEKVHWLLYVPAGMFAFAGMTGICPGLILWSKVLREGECCASR